MSNQISILNSWSMPTNDLNLNSSIALLEEEKYSLKATHSNSEIVTIIVKKKDKGVTYVSGVVPNTKTQIIC